MFAESSADNFFNDKSRRNSTLVSVAEWSVAGGLLVPAAIRVGLRDPVLGAVYLLAFFAVALLMLALNAEIWFDLSSIEHVLVWSLPALFAYYSLLAFLHPWAVVSALEGALFVLVPLDCEAAVVAFWIRRWINFVGDHPYLVDTFVATRPRLVKGFAWGSVAALVGVTALVWYSSAFF
ncbi:MAG: hypothetical protein ACTSU5_12575 [Promethearchaeota archaeon]